MSATPPVDLSVVASWIAEHEAVSEPLRAQRIGNGQSNLTYLLTDAADRHWVLRRPPTGQILQSAHDVGREHRIMSALQGTDVPVPRVLGLWHDDDVAHMVMGCVDGLVVDSVRAAEPVPEQVRGAIGPSIARTLGKVHAVDLAQVGLDDLARHGSYAERQLSRWTRQLDASRTRDMPELDRLTELLQSNVPQQSETTLVHGDLHLSNAICDPETGQVRAALDWELSTLGEPLADLGTLLAYWPEPGEAPEGDHYGATAMPGFSRRQQLVDAYADATGRDLSSLGFWHVLGVWKVVVILQGVLKRVQDRPELAALGGTPDVPYQDLLVHRAWRLVDGYGL